MDEFGCDYECRTVGESIIKYNIPNDWSAEFDVYDDVYPVICIQVDEIRKTPAIMDLKLRVVDWSQVDKEDYMLAMERSPIKDIEIKHVLKVALTDQVDDREMFMKGVDHSYYYEDYTTFKAEKL